eukprot:2943444-Amphidinium_carterae.1
MGGSLMCELQQWVLSLFYNLEEHSNVLDLYTWAYSSSLPTEQGSKPQASKERACSCLCT